MSFDKNFSTENAQKYFAEITNLVSSINTINQQIFQISQQYVKEGYEEYSTHLKSLFNLKSPMEALEANRKYMEHSAVKFQQLVRQRYALFQELMTALGSVKANGFTLPESVQEMLNKFKDSSNLDAFKPENWSKFTEFFKAK